MQYNGTLYLLVRDPTSPTVAAIVANLTQSLSGLVGDAGVRQGPIIEPIQGLPVWQPSADAINDLMYCGYEDSRCNGTSNQYNELPLAWDFLNTTSSGTFNIRMWYNATDMFGDEGGSGGGPPQIVRMHQGVNTAANAFLEWTLGPDYKAQMIGIMDMPKVKSIF